MSVTDTINNFLSAIFSGNMDEALSLVDDEAIFISARPEKNVNNPLHGTFTGKSGAKDFFSGFASLLEPGTFDVEHQHEKDEHVVMYGKLEHVAKKTNKKFKSNWCLISKVEQGRVTLYHFYEDTEALYFAIN